MKTTVAGFILRTGNRVETSKFYAELGLNIKEHRHGGPIHNEVGPMSQECTLEIYLRSQTFTEDVLMLNVNSIDEALCTASKFNIQPQTALLKMQDSNYIYITDPDGRSLMLIEKIQD